MWKSKNNKNSEIKILTPLINITEPKIDFKADSDVKILSPIICVGTYKISPKQPQITSEQVEVQDARIILSKPSPIFFIMNGFIILLLTAILAVLSYMMFSTSIRDEQFFINLTITPIFFYFLYDRIKLVYSTLLYGPKKPKKKEKGKKVKENKSKKKKSKKKNRKKEKKVVQNKEDKKEKQSVEMKDKDLAKVNNKTKKQKRKKGKGKTRKKKK